ncbi:hypothetical protein LR48_Vigan848s000300 [Vigna angularis]|uniref:RING-type E3 ubiquitin transferase n=1 Tax=Phaseolus angularis TaxID=3914 RepID=A0A0L9THY1_PHAAN|nr:hypothetical protein LR48_Vigan848s000300 [Vigna angularis]
MQSQHYYYNVVRLNNQHTTVEPGDTFNFDIKVIYHTVHTIPHGLRNRFSPLSISCREFVQEGQNFLGSLLSGLSFSIESIAEISESVVSTVQELFEDSSIASESQHRIIPLSLTIIIVDPAGIDGVMEESRTFPGMNQSNETILKTFLKKRTDTEGSEECCICLEGLDINCESCTMPCHHAFHQQCILKWLKTKRVCPLCRYPLPTPEN